MMNHSPLRCLLGLAVTAAGLAPQAQAQFDTLELFGDASNTTPASSYTITGGTIAITSGGSDYWANSDNGVFLWDNTGAFTTMGDFTATVRHAGTTTPAPEWGRDGIMARATQNPGQLSATDAYWMAARKSNGQVVINRRSTPGGATFRATDVDNAAVNYDSDDNDRALATGSVEQTPWFLSAARQGGRLYSGYAMDLGGGIPGRFIQQWATEAPQAVQNFAAGTELIVGLAHQSHPQSNSPDSRDINTGTFDHWTYDDEFDFTKFGNAAGNGSWQLAGSIVPSPATGQVHGSAYVQENGQAAADPVKWTVQVYPLSSFSPSFGISGTRRDPTGMNNGLLVPAENFRQGGEGSPAGLVADIYINQPNGGNLGANLALIASPTATKASAVIPNVFWSSNNYPVDDALQNVFALAHPGQFGNQAEGQNNYGVEMKGQIFIPGDADRIQPNLPGEFILFKEGTDDFCYLEIDGKILINDNDWTGTSSTDNSGGNITVLDVSDPKFNNGAWVSFRMIMWEGGGGDNAALYWDQNFTGLDPVFTVDSVPGTFGNLVPQPGLAGARKDPSPAALEDLVPAADFRHDNGGVNQPGLRADIFLGTNPGNYDAINAIVQGNTPVASPVISNIHWYNSASSSTYPSNGTGGDVFGDAGVPVEAAGGVLDGNGYRDYGVNMTGQIFIPGDGQRKALPVTGGNNLVLFKDGVDDFTYLEIDGQVLINDNIWTGPSATDNGGGQVSLLDVSDAKYDDGEWVSFRMTTWEGTGGDSGVLYWSARDANSTFGISSIPGSTAPSFEIGGVSRVGSESGTERFGSLTLPAGDWLTVLRLQNTGTTAQRISSVSVAGTPGAALEVTSFSFNPATSLLNLAFTSETGASYALEYTIGFQPAGTPPSAQKWSTVPSHSNITGQNGTTVINPLDLTNLVAPAGLLPDASKCFFRIRKL